jgi:hypothetical protein
MMPRSALLAAIVAALTFTVVAHAQDNAETRAREAFERGYAELNAQQFQSAASAFEESYRLRPVPTVLYNLGLAYLALHRTADALDALTRYRAHPEAGADPSQLSAVDQEIARQRPSVARLVIRVTPPDAQVLVDGRARDDVEHGVLLDPGAHVLEARAIGFHDARLEVPLRAGDDREVALRPERFGASALAATLRLAETNAAQADRARRTQYGLIAGGAAVTVVGVGLAGVLQAIGWRLHDDYVAQCVSGSATAPA